MFVDNSTRATVFVVKLHAIGHDGRSEKKKTNRERDKQILYNIIEVLIIVEWNVYDHNHVCGPRGGRIKGP